MLHIRITVVVITEIRFFGLTRIVCSRTFLLKYQMKISENVTAEQHVLRNTSCTNITSSSLTNDRVHCGINLNDGYKHAHMHTAACVKNFGI